MKKGYNFLMVTLLFSTVFVITKCDKTKDNVDPLAIKLANSATLGSYLTDKEGNALYFFANDYDGANNCTGGCTTAWPIFDVPGLTQDQLASDLVLADFSSITTPGGNQLTYKGWPLYYYAPGGVRENPGQTLSLIHI